MDVVDALYRLGGVASHRALTEATSRWHVRAAVEAGRIQRLGRDSYALPGRDAHADHAHRLRGVLSHLSGAMHRGWPVWEPPRRATVTVPRTRKVDPRRRRGCQVIWQDVVQDGVSTTALQTVLDCAARLPFHEALAVADAALRLREVSHAELLDAASRAGRRWRSRTLHVARHASALADNPFESVVRAHTIEVPGIDLAPQVFIPGYGRADLVDLRRALVVECDSFAFHSSRAALLNDIERYNRAAGLGLTLVRFGYEHAHQPDYIRSTLRSAVMPPPQRHALTRCEAA